MGEVGLKYDAEKDRWELLPWDAVHEVVLVMTFGAKKYGPHNWVQVQGARDRYLAAAHRHLYAWQQGEVKDPESSLHHLSHAACCVLFLLALDLRGKL